MANLKNVLKKLVKDVQEELEDDFDGEIEELHVLVTDMMQKRWFMNPSRELAGDFRDDVVELKDICHGLDAIAVMKEKILKKGQTSQDFTIPQHRRQHVADIAAFVRELEADKELPQRGFVYVAWKDRPRIFLYVGKASTKGRITNTKGHHRLPNALGESSTLSLLMPPQSRQEIVRDVEAATLKLLDMADMYPKYNDRREPVGPHAGAQRMKRLGEFFTMMGNLFDRPS